MKYLQDERLTQLTNELTDAVTNSRVINGRIEAFTTKRGGVEKKYANKLGEKLVEELTESQDQLQVLLRNTRKRSASTSDATTIPPPPPKLKRASSFDSTTKCFRAASSLFSESFPKRLLTDLILTLNVCFPDYDFGTVRPSNFLQQSLQSTMANINGKLSELAQRKPPSFLQDLWRSLDKCILLADCEVYSYVPSPGDDDDAPLGFLTQTLLQEQDGAGGDDGTNTSSPPSLWSFNYFFVNKQLKRIVFFSCVETMLNEVSDEEADYSDDVYMVKSSHNEVNFDLDPTSNVAGGVPVGSL